MNIVPIPPISLIDHPINLRWPYQFALVHLCEHYGENSDYVKKYAELGRSPDHFLIMDNGAFELGGSKSLDLILKWAYNLQPDEIVLPDRMFMMRQTLKLTKEAFEPVTDLVTHWEKNVSLQGVIHGLNHTELLECAHEFSILGIDTIAIPKDYQAFSGGRQAIAAMIRPYEIPIHLLGMEKDYWGFTNWWDKSGIRSMDTVKPFLMSMEPNPVDMWLHRGNYAVVDRPDDYFNLPEADFNLEMLLQNLQDWTTIYNRR